MVWVGSCIWLRLASFCLPVIPRPCGYRFTLLLVRWDLCWREDQTFQIIDSSRRRVKWQCRYALWVSQSDLRLSHDLPPVLSNSSQWYQASQKSEWRCMKWSTLASSWFGVTSDVADLYQSWCPSTTTAFLVYTSTSTISTAHAHSVPLSVWYQSPVSLCTINTAPPRG